jgi:peptide/nickel transport system substrate-binding protein
MKQTVFKKLMVFLVTVCMFFALTEFSKAGEKATKLKDIKTSKDHLIVALPTDPGNFDPNNNNIQMVQAMKKQIYETLIYRDYSGKLQPQLAESWEYQNDNTIIFHIRKGVKFHNGEELKASDVIFTLKRIKDTPASQLGVQRIDFDKTIAVDDYTVKVVTKDIFVPQLAYFEWALMGIFNEKAYKESGGDFTKAPIGTGAYKLKSYVSGDRYEFEAFKDYWDKGKPYCKTLTMRIITEATNRTIELESGGVDIIYEAPSSDIPRLEKSKETVVYRDPSMNTNYLFFRCDHKPFDDVRVRLAFSYALDRNTAVKSAYRGTGVTAIGFFSPGVEGFAADVKPYNYNITKAKQLLAEAGYPNGFKTTFHTDTTRERMDITEIFQNQLRKVGIECKVITMEPVAYQAMFARGEHNIMVYGLTATTGEADRALRWFHKDNATGQTFVAWKNNKFCDLIDEASRTLDPAKRTKLYKQAQQILKDECVVVPTLHREILTAARKNVKGFQNNITYESPYLKNVYFE